jgi:hypothetical protein
MKRLLSRDADDLNEEITPVVARPFAAASSSNGRSRRLPRQKRTSGARREAVL